MNRRNFLRGLVGGAVVAPAALAELLSPKPTIFLPPRGGWLPANAGIPSFLVNYIDPEIINVLLEPMKATVVNMQPLYYNDEGIERIKEAVMRMMPRIEIGMGLHGEGIARGTRIIGLERG